MRFLEREEGGEDEDRMPSLWRDWLCGREIESKRKGGGRTKASLCKLTMMFQIKWVFDIFNFIFLLVFILPVVLVIALNLWVKTSVVDGECPNCGSRVRHGRLGKQEGDGEAAGDAGKEVAVSVYDVRDAAAG